MQDDRLIAEWAGLYVTPTGWIMADGEKGRPCPDYTTSDAAAITLLPVLVERGYETTLESWKGSDGNKYHQYKAVKEDHKLDSGICQSIATAITTAILELIKGETSEGIHNR